MSVTFTKNTIWGQISLLSRLSIHESKIHVPRFYKKMKKGEVLNISENLLIAVEFYSDNIDLI